MGNLRLDSSGKETRKLCGGYWSNSYLFPVEKEVEKRKEFQGWVWELLYMLSFSISLHTYTGDTKKSGVLVWDLGS